MKLKYSVTKGKFFRKREWGLSQLCDHTRWTRRLYMGFQAAVFHIRPDFHPSSTLSRIAFGMEPHTLIMAMTCGVPVVHASPLRHGRKGWMFSDLGLGDNLFDIDATPAETVSARVHLLHHGISAARADAHSAREKVESLQTRCLNVIE